MADPLIRAPAGLLALALLGLPAVAAAQPMADPTRPPTASPAADAAAPAGYGTPVLQSVILRSGQKPRALISGELVEQGGKYGDMRVVKITADTAILRGASGRVILALTPEASKRPAKPAKAQAGTTK